jgi:hypothetical protein
MSLQVQQLAQYNAHIALVFYLLRFQSTNLSKRTAGCFDWEPAIARIDGVVAAGDLRLQPEAGQGRRSIIFNASRSVKDRPCEEL